MVPSAPPSDKRSNDRRLVKRVKLANMIERRIDIYIVVLQDTKI
jgi:hypothetical protein